MIVLRVRQMGFCSIVAAQSLSRLFWPNLGYFSSFPKKPPSERPNPWGPLPLHTMMAAGDSSLEELIRGVDRGIYVTRFHYTNTVHPVKTLFTGMTRDGTFLIEHGELTSPVKNFRFTQSILDALRDVQAIGRERIRCRDYTPVVAPAVRIGSFSFTGVTGT